MKTGIGSKYCVVCTHCLNAQKLQRLLATRYFDEAGMKDL